jgi:hypothetical protein
LTVNHLPILSLPTSARASSDIARILIHLAHNKSAVNCCAAKNL